MRIGNTSQGDSAGVAKTAINLLHGNFNNFLMEGPYQNYMVEVFNVPEGHICCGSAGTYNLLQTDIAKKLLKNKISNIDKVKPQFITTGNIGCITQIANGTKIPILHTIEVIDWYTGGPKPKILRNL